MQSRAGRPRRDVERLGDLDEGQPEVVVQDEDGPLLDREFPEPPLELIPVDDREAGVRVGRPSDGRARMFATHRLVRRDSA